MKKYRYLIVLAVAILWVSCGTSSTSSTGGGTGETGGTTGGDTVTGTVLRSASLIVDHSAVTGFLNIPSTYVDQAKSLLNIFYGHTSHGSQLITGMGMLPSPYNSGLTLQDNDGVDLGHNGDTGWVTVTEDALAADPTINVVMWSWCGGVADNTTEGMNTYLHAMDQLEQNYPGVTFIYMTGRHWNQDGSASVDGEGPATNTHIEQMNNMIRTFSRNYNKVMFDFADIEEYDLDGNRHSDTSDYCSWCGDYASQCGSCGGGDCCAHSQACNCYVKGRAFWWMLARLAGWDGN